MKRRLLPEQDAFGHALMDHLEGRGGEELIERSDGYLDRSAGAETYFAEPTGEQAAVADRASGRVLDVGCGAGRYALYLQEKGLEVVAIDASPLAVEVCRRRGLRDARVLTLQEVDGTLGQFDTVLMLGNNFGLMGGHRGAKSSLSRLRHVVRPGGCILAETMDPYQSGNPDHLSYHADNLVKGRMGGQIRMRMRYKKYKTPWFDYLFVARGELEDIVRDSGWRIQTIIAEDGPSYVALLERTA
jgi:SAM-dependent methyltransferase